MNWGKKHQAANARIDVAAICGSTKRTKELEHQEQRINLPQQLFRRILLQVLQDLKSKKQSQLGVS